jgi:lipopolysaccharide cholinephosphotransferase
MLEILDVFVYLCEKYKIDYWLYAGTVLGARRHKGFIPWDDDLDVIILRKDHEKLMRVLKNELPDNLKLQSRKTDKNYKLFYDKIRDVNSVYYESGKDKYKYNGVFIDIFSIEQMPSLFLKKTIDSIVNSSSSFKGDFKTLKKLKYFIMILLIPIANIVIAISRFFFDKRGKGIYQYAFGIRDYNFANITYFYPIRKIEFEGKKYNVPGDMDRYLANHFGHNYMSIPANDKRRTHAQKIEIF